ncbi:MAG: MmgE/PrpD family protein [Gammaproteobacteria bacterium]|nr:MmgE/PrpD family protein [Gammaproteobacteria bacterium]
MKKTEHNGGHDITERLALFISSFSSRKIPAVAIERVKCAIIDYVGVTLAGSSRQNVKKVCSIAEGGTPHAAIWGTGKRTSVHLAALANGTASHALELDDISQEMVAHPSIQLLPGLCAMAEYRHSSGIDVINAYLAGFETGIALARAVHPEHIKSGWFTVGTIGPIMQAAACANLIGLSSLQTCMALALAANTASGLRCNNGTDAKPLLAGQAAANGTMAAQLASQDFSANTAVLESHFGFCENFSNGDIEKLELSISALGQGTLAIVESGLSFKRYPCCGATHTAIDCMLHLVNQYDMNADVVRSIHISIHESSKIFLIHPRPRSPDEAKFSLEYCICRALLDKQIGSLQFQSTKITEPILQALMGKVVPDYFDKQISAEEIKLGRFPVTIDIELLDGTHCVEKVLSAKGTLDNPFTASDIEEKFRQCVCDQLSAKSTNALLRQLQQFESIQDFSEICKELG